MPRSHKNLPRIFVDADLETADVTQKNEITLDRDQMHHLVHVLRRGAGDQCVLFNGRHGAFLATIADVRKKHTQLEIAQRIADQPEPVDLWYGFAPLKAGRLDYMVQKATEMGVGMVQPVRTQFTQAGKLRTDKLVAHTIEAAQQCEVLSLPEIGAEIGLENLVRQWPQAHGDRQLIFADEELAAASPVDALSALTGQRVGLLIGPEGGFSSQERELLAQQPFVHPISLGPRILRADTAAVAALALVQAIIGDWR